MHHPVQLAVFLLAATTLGAVALALRPHADRPLGHVIRAGVAFTSILFALKLLPLFLPEEGFLRSDGLYPLWARWEPAVAGRALLHEVHVKRLPRAVG